MTPGAHSNTVLSFSVLAAFRLAGFFFLLFAVSKRKRKQPSVACMQTSPCLWGLNRLGFRV